uniref:Uncharacterized protein n=1 Tax=Oryza punctata TaxID=4537 RepID=A0A0E0LAX6_ORYPU
MKSKQNRCRYRRREDVDEAVGNANPIYEREKKRYKQQQASNRPWERSREINDRLFLEMRCGGAGPDRARGHWRLDPLAKGAPETEGPILQRQQKVDPGGGDG